MPQQAAMIEGLPVAFEVMKSMQAQGLEWGEDYRRLGRQALVEILEGRMEEWLDQRPEEMASEEVADRRNGHNRRRLLTELGDIELAVPRTRRFNPTKVLLAYARTLSRCRARFR